MNLPESAVAAIVERALAEDVGWGDLTTSSLIPAEARATAAVILKEDGVVCGLEVMALTFSKVDRSVRCEALVGDGTPARAGAVLARVAGPAASILTAERVALNFLQRLSGIATLTARYVEALRGRPVRLVETRKTTPGLRLLEKYAVRVGGGANHRQNLSDGVLIKDNHLAVLRSLGVGLGEAVARARAKVPHSVRVEVEVETLAELEEALAAGADAVLLDNMAPAELQEAVARAHGRALLEASGGITLANLAAVAATGVDVISVGALTHSVGALDISLEIEPA